MKHTPQPPGRPGKIELDPKTGEPTGILRSAAQFVKAPSRERASQADQLKRLKMLMADYNSVGLTSVADRDASDSEVELYRALRQKNELTCRVFLNYHV